MNNLIFGGTATGGNQDDYRYRVNWVASGSNRYFYKYADMEDTGKIENTMIPMLRIGEMYLIAAESQSTSLTAGSSYVNTLRRNRGVTTVSSLTQDLLVYVSYTVKGNSFISIRDCTDLFYSRPYLVKIRKQVIRYS